MENLMLVTTLTVALVLYQQQRLLKIEVTLAGGTQVTAFASEGDIDGGIAVEHRQSRQHQRQIQLTQKLPHQKQQYQRQIQLMQKLSYQRK